MVSRKFFRHPLGSANNKIEPQKGCRILGCWTSGTVEQPHWTSRPNVDSQSPPTHNGGNTDGVQTHNQYLSMTAFRASACLMLLCVWGKKLSVVSRKVTTTAIESHPPSRAGILNCKKDLVQLLQACCKVTNEARPVELKVDQAFLHACKRVRQQVQQRLQQKTWPYEAVKAFCEPSLWGTQCMNGWCSSYWMQTHHVHRAPDMKFLRHGQVSNSQIKESCRWGQHEYFKNALQHPLMAGPFPQMPDFLIL